MNDDGLRVPSLTAEKGGVRLSLVVPTYNERINLRELLEALANVLRGRVDGGFELIVVDDDSPDRTWELATELAEEIPELEVVRRRERGLATAVIRGWQQARGEVLGVIDGDLQHPPETVVRLLQAIDDGADLAVGSRHVAGGGVSIWSARRRVLSRGAQLLGWALLPRVVGRVADPMSGYFMLRRASIADRPLRPLGYKILVEVLARGDFADIREVGYVFRERAEGDSKVTAKVYLDYLLHLARLRLESLT